ncbi:MAG: acyl-CoA thioesterase [Pyrinomonadaceae bacterium]
MTDWHETQIRVRYAETDKMGVVHHSNYAIWFEIGRSEFCRARGFSYREMEDKEDVSLVVAELYCRYTSPAFYEDELTVRTKIGELRSRTLRFVYEIYRAFDNTILAEGETLHVVTDADKRVRSMPEVYKKMLLIKPKKNVENTFAADYAPR